MQKSFLAAVVLCISILQIPAQTTTDWSTYDFNLPSKDSPDTQWWRDSRTNLDHRLAWWRDARFGMFIHWGVYSYAGGTWQGKPVRGYAEHIQRIMKIPGPVYRREIAGNFDPTNFDADAWVRLARDAGMKYIVITAKHHDGFAMWPTKVNDYNVMDATPWHHDPMKDLKAACQNTISNSVSIIRRPLTGPIPTRRAMTGTAIIPVATKKSAAWIGGRPAPSLWTMPGVTWTRKPSRNCWN